MEVQRLRELLGRLLEGSLSDKEYSELTSYIAGMVKNISNRLGYELKEKSASENMPKSILEAIGGFLPQGENPLSFVVSELIVHLLKKREKLSVLVKRGENVNGYLAVLIRNLLIDIYNRLKKNVPLAYEDSMKGEEDNRDVEDIARSLNPEACVTTILEYELIELEELLLSVLEEEEIKYVCYKKDSKRYKCLWKDKSDAAIYQDVRRKGEKVLNKLSKALSDAGVSRELLDEFSQTRLSGICEELRLKICGEEER